MNNKQIRLAVALIGAIALVTAAHIAKSSSGAQETPSAVHSVSAEPAIFEVVSNGAEARRLTVPLTTGYGDTAIRFDHGTYVRHSLQGDMGYGVGPNGPELGRLAAVALSTDVNASNASEAHCRSVTRSSSARHRRPIIGLHAGQLFCVETNDHGLALVEITQDVGASQKLHLGYIYWP